MKHFLIMGLLIIAGAGAFAQSALVTVEDAVAKAIEQSLSLKMGAVDLETARVNAANIWAQLFPELSLSASASYKAGNFEPSFSTGITFRFNAGLPAAMKLIRDAYKTNLLSYEDSKKKLEIEVRRKFWELMAQKAGINVLKQRYDMAVRQFEESDAGFQAGNVNLLAREENRLEMGQASLALKQGETAMKTALGEFFVALGDDWGAQSELAGSLLVYKMDLDAEGLIAMYLANNPDVVMKKRALETARLLRNQGDWQARAPSLSVSGTYSPDMKAHFAPTFGASIGISVPLEVWIPGTIANQGVKKTAAAQEKAAIDLEITEKAVKNSIRGLVSALEGDWDSIVIARLGVEVAERTLGITADAHNQGSVDTLTLISARNGLTTARQELLKAELTYKNTVLDLIGVLNITEKELGHY
jgi:outer membrane protein TolC